MSARAILFRRPYPSANCVLLPGARPVLVDTGAGSDADATEGWLHLNGVSPSQLALVVNTHHHSDHVGGNHRLASRGVPIAMHSQEAGPINRRAPDACRAQWLDQDVQAFAVDRVLEDGEYIGTGEDAGGWQVVATPGHSLGHISLFHAGERLLIVGDLFHADGVGWVDLSGGMEPLEQALTSLDRVEALGAVRAVSGHGPVIDDVFGAIGAARARLIRWRTDPTGAAWHACKRIFVHLLMTEDGLMRGELMPALLARPWLLDTASHPLSMTPEAFAEALVAETVRAGAVAWRGDRLLPVGGYVPPLPGWSDGGPTRPRDW